MLLGGNMKRTVLTATLLDSQIFTLVGAVEVKEKSGNYRSFD